MEWQSLAALIVYLSLLIRAYRHGAKDMFNLKKAGPVIVAFSLALSVPAVAANDDAAHALESSVASRSADDRARDSARHPAQTLRFFRVEPGMSVAEALPGGGWYTRVLAPYLGTKGTIAGVNYSNNIWPLFGFMDDTAIATRIAATEQFPQMVADITDNGISARGFTFAAIPEDMRNSVDRVLVIRALHNLNRFESAAGTRSQALAAINAMLKEDGMVGVVQHRAPESASTPSTDGRRGYLKQSEVIAAFENAGFELLATSELNANPKDQPKPEDIVWRLPPSLSSTGDNPEGRAAMEAIGESDRMTLLFKKTKT
ncbi:MAG: putative methyltransferase [Halioglobus sp.]|jgi:predicted methyltransferase